ncbi:MAG: hypothetical protein R2882_07995 [Gemmatimonadales bacterium]
MQLARIAALEGRRDELDRRVETALASSPAADQALGLKVLRAFANGSREEQDEVSRVLAVAPGLVIARGFADVALYAGDLDGASRLAAAVLPAARSAEFAALGRIVLAHLELARGRVSEALGHLAEAAAHQPAWVLEVRGLFATLPDTPIPRAEREAIEQELMDWDPEAVPASVAVPLVFHDGLHAHFRQYLLGLLAARRREPAAVRLAGEALSELAVPDGAEVLAEQLARTLDAEALRLRGRPAEALAVLERLTTDVWFQFAVGSPFYAGTHHRFLRAELLADLGRRDEAVRWWSTVAQRSPYELVFAPAARARLEGGRPDPRR